VREALRRIGMFQPFLRFYWKMSVLRSAQLAKDVSTLLEILPSDSGTPKSTHLQTVSTLLEILPTAPRYRDRRSIPGSFNPS